MNINSSELKDIKLKLKAIERLTSGAIEEMRDRRCFADGEMQKRMAGEEVRWRIEKL